MRKIISLLIACLAAVQAFAVQVNNTAGKLETKVTDYSITSLTVTGEMDARDFKFISTYLLNLKQIDLSNVTIKAYSDDTNMVFDNVVSYDANAVPPTAFFGMKLEKATLPSNLTAIEQAAFAGCDRLATVNIPSDLAAIGDYAFTATAITSITLHNNVISVGEGAFANCPKLATATINNADIGDNAFLNCAKLATVTLGTGVKAIGNGAFQGCKLLQNLTFSGTNNITTIGNKAFLASGINQLNLAQFSKLTYLGDWALATSPLTKAALPSTLMELGKGAFLYDLQLTEATVPQKVTELGEYTFAGASNLTTITLSKNLTQIDDYALYNTSGLTKVEIPASVDYLGNMAMAGMKSLKEVTTKAKQVPNLGDKVREGVKQSNVDLMVRSNMVTSFAAANQWKLFNIKALADVLKGDVNGDGVVDVRDVTTLINHILGYPVTVFIPEAADINEDGEIDVQDVTAIINLILTGGPKTAPQAEVNTSDQLGIAPITIKPGETKAIDININASRDYAAMQFDIELPQGLSVTSSPEALFTSANNLVHAEIENNTTRVAIFSL
ncbi:MAG: leucine-rich repeat protein, partial [Muribaculaceae bacterium]|nr:leucine-rich repeat protein [Muribaculaceae bacterium]